MSVRLRGAVTVAAAFSTTAAVALSAILSLAVAPALAATTPITLSVDATEAPRHILHTRLQIPAKPGPLTLLYPKWIPGEHGPTGPIHLTAGLMISAGGRSLDWRRDPVEMYAFHCVVPSGAQAVDVSFDYLIPDEGARGTSSVSSKLAVLDWNQLILYPKGTPAESLTVKATLRIPPGWKSGTALPVERSSTNEVVFKPASLVTLVDSPVLTGAHFRVIPLAPDLLPKHQVNLAADSPEALEIDSGLIARYDRLVREALALFGAPHYREYRFLFALSDRFSYAGLEHHESSDNRSPERALLEPDQRVRVAQLFPHELAHSWNGKHRRPAAMSAAPYLEPMQTDLLWIYEGLTEYLAWVLAARSDLLTFEQSLADLAQIGATVSNQAGRSWRPLRDVAGSAPMTGRAGRQWAAWKRGFGDVYSEGVLIWLEADAIIRRESAGARSLDDFLRGFFGGKASGPVLKTYQIEDVVAALQSVAAYDWANFFESRVNRVSKRPPAAGIEGEGWRLVYSDTLSPYIRSIERARKLTYLTFSIGIIAGSDGVIIDLDPNLPAAKAGLAPGMRLVSVNGRKWTGDRGREAIRAAKSSGRPIDIVAESADFPTTYRIHYRGGERYPRLVRDPAKPDYLTDLLSPKSKAR